jgi:hypothetical protein
MIMLVPVTHHEYRNYILNLNTQDERAVMHSQGRLNLWKASKLAMDGPLSHSSLR